MRRLEVGAIRICKRCRRGRAELLTDDGESLFVRLGPNRARQLADLPTTGAVSDVPWLGALVTRAVSDGGALVSDVVLDEGPQGLRGLVTWTGTSEGETVVACEPEEALEVAMRLGVPIYASDDALRPADDDRPEHTLH